MKLAISNIAWPAARDREVAAAMRRHGFAGVELAPTKYWPEPLSATAEAIDEVRAFWASEGISVVALQALLFGTTGLALFGEPSARRATADHLAGIIRLGARLGASTLVFGSPKNRLRGARSHEEADAIAVPFFRTLGDLAAAEGTCLAIEANPARYGCDWITTSAEAEALVRAVGSPGFGLHLDAAGITLAGDDLEATVTAAGAAIRHFHASEPDLQPLGPGGAVDHAAAATALRRLGYGRWVSIEMREPSEGDPLVAVSASLAHVASVYGP